MLTGIVLTKDSESTLKKCLKSLSFCDKILVVDNHSTDKTTDIAKTSRADIIQRKLEKNFAAQRNFAMEKAADGWILFVDADETVSAELKEELESVIARNKVTKQSHEIATLPLVARDDNYTAYKISRQDVFLGKKLQWGEVRKAYTEGIIRLMKRGSGEWRGRVHETFVTKESVGSLSGLIHHYPHPKIADFLHDINEYSTIRAEELLKEGKSANILQIIFVPPAKFFYTYFLKRGFLDGPEGFIYSFMMSFHSFLVRAKLYLLKSK